MMCYDLHRDTTSNIHAHHWFDNNGKTKAKLATDVRYPLRAVNNIALIDPAFIFEASSFITQNSSINVKKEKTHYKN